MKSALARWLAPFRSRAFLWLWSGQGLSSVGNRIGTVVLPLAVLAMTGSTLDTGLAVAAQAVPIVVLLLGAGAIADRVNKVRMMQVADLGRFLAQGTIGVLLWVHRANLAELLVLEVIYGTLTALFGPASAGIRQKVFDPTMRNEANAVWNATSKSATIIGPPLGGALVALGSGAIGFIADAFSFLVSAASLAFLPASLGQVTDRRKRTPFLRDVREGLDIVRNTSWLRMGIIVTSFLNLTVTSAVAILVPRILQSSSQLGYLYGFSMALYGAGGVIGSVISPYLRIGTSPAKVFYGSILGLAPMLVMMGVVRSLLIFPLFTGAVGFLVTLGGIKWDVAMQNAIPEEAFGRVSSIDMVGSLASLPVGLVVMGWLAEAVGARSTVLVGAALMLILGVVGLARGELPMATEAEVWAPR